MAKVGSGDSAGTNGPKSYMDRFFLKAMLVLILGISLRSLCPLR
jgi:hypothetical protein